MSIHYTESYLLNPTHRITVSLIGCGGTGTQVLSGLARLNEALLGLGHPGLFVTVFDADEVTESNIGRQLFSPADIGMNKAIVSVSRINRFFGYDWIAAPYMYNHMIGSKCEYKSNITISCVDSVKSRKQIQKVLKRHAKYAEPNLMSYYWMDFGNSHKSGQVVLGTTSIIEQEFDEHAKTLPDVFAVFPELSKKKDKDTGPSCSIAQALGKQDLFINSTLAQLGLNILWKMFREIKLSYHGCFLNLDTMNVNPIKI